MPSETSSNLKLIGGIVAITALIFIGLAWVIIRQPQESEVVSEESVVFQDEQDPVSGSTTGTVVVRMYGDFECPACKFAEPAVKYAMDKYKDRVRFVWKDFPLPNHRQARSAANAARCAQSQSKFWEYHDTLYEKQDEWTKADDPRDAFLRYGTNLGLEAKAFKNCISTSAEDGRVQANMGEGEKNRIDRTPTFFVNKRRYFGVSPADWDKVINQALRDRSW